MTISQSRLDALWDFSDPAGSELRLRAARAEAPDDATRAELDTQVARALGLQGRFAEADALIDTLGAPDHAAVAARIALERGRLRNSGGDPVAAVSLFHSAAAVAASARLTFLHVDAIHMLAIADPERAEEWTSEALRALAETADERTLRWHVALHNNAGSVLLDAGRFTEAVHEFESAKDAARRWGTPQQVVWADEALSEARAAQDAARASER
ncbi:hypothetical protein [Microbacterium sp. 2FI]|uniref:hypothetical protein n=1 Tax=Microbacterium sp. 2FI TaxID=2502193 RepID=UPI0010F461A4|nr:hypothetical protein [Microbacterium sp. 2FI]